MHGKHGARLGSWILAAALAGCGGGGTVDADAGDDDRSSADDAATGETTADDAAIDDTAPSDAPDGDGTAGDDSPVDGDDDADAASEDATTDATGDGAGCLPGDNVVSTVEGPLRGERSGELVVFRGIPYVEPPVGSLRFRPPVRHAPWTETRDALTFGPPCLKRERTGVSGAEDCLRLNVWAHACGGPRPVLFYIHGGAFTGGEGALPLFDGTALAGVGDAVIVTINYRLGALGFLATAALAAESADGSVGNYGIRDQVAALEWVRRNIAAFGGDPENVTVFGESAGAMSICALIGSPLADGLFDRAILESGGGCHGFEEPDTAYAGRASMFERGQALVAAVGCDGAADEPACLRTLVDPTRITAAQPDAVSDLARTLQAVLEYAPNLDGVLLAEQPIERLRRGAVDLPIVIGSNADEARAFTAAVLVPTWAGFENRVRAILGDADGDVVIPLYPRADYATPKHAYDAFLSDVGLICPTVSLAVAAQGGVPVFVYYFTRVMEGTLGALGATHATELFFVFGNFPDRYTPVAADLAVSADMQRAWTTFAATGTPALAPAWPPYDSAAPRFAVFDDPASIATDIRGGRCAELRRLGILP